MSLTASDILKTMDSTPAPARGTARLSAVRGSAAAKTPAPAAGFAQLLKHRAAVANVQAQDVKEQETKHREQAEKAAGDLVSNALILPMLKQLRRSVWGENTVFSRGMGEKAFGPQFDMQISDRIAHSPRLGLKTALTERLLKRGQPDAAGNNNQAQDQPNGGIDLHG
jgi:hypothetical protein